MLGALGRLVAPDVPPVQVCPEMHSFVLFCPDISVNVYFRFFGLLRFFRLLWVVFVGFFKVAYACAALDGFLLAWCFLSLIQVTSVGTVTRCMYTYKWI